MLAQELLPFPAGSTTRLPAGSASPHKRGSKAWFGIVHGGIIGMERMHRRGVGSGGLDQYWKTTTRFVLGLAFLALLGPSFNCHFSLVGF